MLTYLPQYQILICDEHQHAIYSLDEHFKRYHTLPIAERRALIALYSSYALLLPTQVTLPTPPTLPFAELGCPQDAFCCYHPSPPISSSSSSSSSSSRSLACGFISTSRKWMRRHVNQQHSVKLTR
jgi:hypothetical protein